MAESKENATLLSERMRRDWDRRVEHDYRFWMSDGVSSDAEMWAVGQRDFELITKDYPRALQSHQTALELGCGVGRLLRPAANSFQKVIGIDVSESAVRTAKKLLSDLTNVNVVTGTGLDLSFIETGSIDFAFSFAAFSSMPVSVAASYLVELNRVLRQAGTLRLQVYIGAEQENSAEDTIAIRSYDEARLRGVLCALGFSFDFQEEIILPFEVSDYQAGMVATLLSLTKLDDTQITAAEVEARLVKDSEIVLNDTWNGSETEYLLALARARQHISTGEFSKASECIEYARKTVQTTDAVLQRIIDELTEAQGSTVLSARGSNSSSVSDARAYASTYFENNMRVVRERFPWLVESLEECIPNAEAYRVDTSRDGNPIVVCREFPLDNISQPQKAAESFVEQAKLSAQSNKKGWFVFGFSTGYHVHSLVQFTEEVFLYEPDVSVLKLALSCKDQRETLQKIKLLDVTPERFAEKLSLHVGKLRDLSPLIHTATKAVHGSSLEKLQQHMSSANVLSELRPSIAVVGPIYGGSLPIAGYVSRALGSLNQRARYIDLGAFYPAYQKISDYVKGKNGSEAMQGQYVEMLSRLVLESVAEKPVDIVLSLAQAPLTPAALTELRKRGIITAMWFVEDCRRFQTWQHISRYYDYMFLIQRDEYLGMVEQAGAGKAAYLPVGCDPNMHCPVQVTPEEKTRWGSQVSFVGAGYNNRQQMFSSLTQYDFKIWGTEWPGAIPFDRLVQERGRRLDPAEYVKIFNASSINLNLHSSSERDGVDPSGDFINPRTFELAACGAFQLVDNRRHLSEMFEIGSELAIFENREELEEKIQYYLSRPEERGAIAHAGRTRALRDHTYEKRLEQMLKIIYADRFDELKSRATDNSWACVLDRSKKHEELHRRFLDIYERGEAPTLDNLYKDIRTGTGSLTGTEQRILFLHHVREMIEYVKKLRAGNA